MIDSTSRIQKVLTGAVGTTLSLAVAAAIGVLPRAAGTASVAGAQPAAVATQVGAAAVAPPVTVAPPPPPPTTAPPTTAPPATTAKVTRRAAPAKSVAATGAAAPTAAAPAAAARVNPSSAQVQAAIAQLRSRIPLFSPTEAQARQFGDQVCTAFDQGQSYSQVTSSVLQAVPQNLFVHVTSADAAFAVRTAVQLVCPGYLSKLG